MLRGCLTRGRHESELLARLTQPCPRGEREQRSTQTAERLRALPDRVGRPVHGGRRAPGPLASRLHRGPARLEFGTGSQINVPIAVLIWLMICPMMMKIDFASLAGVDAPPARPAGHAVRQLAGQAVQHGAPGLAVLPGAVPAADRRGAGQAVHRRRHHPGRGPLHGDGVRLELPDRRRSGLHAGAGGGQRPDHAGAVRPDRRLAGRRVRPGRAVQRAADGGGRVHRHAADRRACSPARR